MQTRLGSFVEAWANIAVGFTVGWASNLLVLPIFGFAVTGTQAFEIGLYMTAISLVRQYVIRRFFNGLKFGTVPNKVQASEPDLQVTRSALLDGCMPPNAYRDKSSSVFPTDAAGRNEFPMYDGLLAYFPAALAAVARVSKIGNDQHNPGQPMHWARGKSMDHKNKIVKHVMDAELDDMDGTLHADKCAWRALALSQQIHEARGAPLAPGARLPEPECPVEHASDGICCSIEQQDDCCQSDNNRCHADNASQHDPIWTELRPQVELRGG